METNLLFKWNAWLLFGINQKRLKLLDVNCSIDLMRETILTYHHCYHGHSLLRSTISCYLFQNFFAEQKIKLFGTLKSYKNLKRWFYSEMSVWKSYMKGRFITNKVHIEHKLNLEWKSSTTSLKRKTNIPFLQLVSSLFYSPCSFVHIVLLLRRKYLVI